MLLLVFDTETTGLDALKCGIVEVAFKPVWIKNFLETDFDTPVKTFKMNPGNVETNEQALAINGYTKQQISELPEYKSIQKQIKAYLASYIDPYSKDKSQRFLLCGHNINFDIPFLLKLWERCNDKYPWSYFQSGVSIDTLILFAEKQIQGRLPYTERHNLETMANTLDVGFDKSLAHGATYDCEITAQCLKKLLVL